MSYEGFTINEIMAAQQQNDGEKLAAMQGGKSSQAWKNYVIHRDVSVKKANMDSLYTTLSQKKTYWDSVWSRANKHSITHVRRYVTGIAEFTLNVVIGTSMNGIGASFFVLGVGKEYDGRRKFYVDSTSTKIAQAQTSTKGNVNKKALSPNGQIVLADNPGPNNVFAIETAWKEWKTAQSRYDTARDAWSAAVALDKKTNPEEYTTNNDTPATTSSVELVTDTGPVKMNLPGVHAEAYFSNDTYFKKNIMFVAEGNAPAKITQASELWVKSGAHKGMLQQYQIPKVKAGTAKKTEIEAKLSLRKNRVAYQFQYNPGTVTQTWAGTPSIDPGYMMSGQNTTTLIRSANATSSVSFQLMINRMPDMKYIQHYDAEKETKKYSWEWTKNQWSKLYYGLGTNSFTEEQLNDIAMIRKMGTMYDIEYLLHALTGYKLYSRLRKQNTADFGYLGGFPVELHLGKNLRYMGTISTLTISHTIFTEQMIPVFTNVEITLDRMPDPKQTAADVATPYKIEGEETTS